MICLVLVLLLDSLFVRRVCSDPDRVRTMYQSFVLDLFDTYGYQFGLPAGSGDPGHACAFRLIVE